MPTQPLSDAQAQSAVDAYEQNSCNGHRAAKSLGIAESTFRGWLKTARQRGMGTAIEKAQTVQGYNPEHGLTHPIPSPMQLNKTTTLYDKDGNIERQWVMAKMSDIQLQKHIETVIATLAKSIEGLSPLVKRPKQASNKLLCAYVMGDPHFGMHADAAESGDDFDLDIAKDTAIKAVDRLISSAPDAKIGLLLPVGDTVHADNKANTTTGGTYLDVAARFHRVLEVTIEAYRHIVLRMLEKHPMVIVRFVGGNHDENSHLALAWAIKAYFSNNKRVVVDLDPSAFWYYKFGKVLIASTHGDKTKQENLLGVMVCDKPQWVGETEHRYFYTGHIHHQTVKEFSGLTCESFQTLAPKDAWHSAKGYRSGRSMLCIVHHEEHGEIERHRCGIGMIQ